MLSVFKTRLAMSFVLAALVVNPALSQTLKDFFTNTQTPALYLGIDFTKTKLIDDATANENDIKDHQYTAINEVVIAEPKKYDVSGAFHRSSMDHDFGQIDQKNVKVDATQIKSTNTSDFHRLKEEDIANVVKGYDFGDKKGIGILFVVEALSKSGKNAAIWVAFIDMKAKKMLMTERMESKAKGGFSWRNYWASAFKDLLDDIEDKKYKEWQSKYQ